jgi:tyrosyl-tRNA synthetase
MKTNFFEKGILEVINKDSLKKKLDCGKKLRIKMGVDPTSADIHLGHAVGLWKLKELQDKGHTIIFLIGDYTTKIGDPSGRNSIRPVLSDAEIKKNAKTYLDQVGKILNIKKTEIKYNSEWYAKMNFSEILKLSGSFTVAQIIERDDFENRLEKGIDVGLHEVLYPVMQAYDSVVLKADVEFGGSDQKFNMLAGRDLQKKMGQAPQDIVMTKLLVGTDGKEKMSKSLGNYIGVNDDSKLMFGKVMSIPDAIVLHYFELCTDKTVSEIKKYEKLLQTGKNPKEIKEELAFEIVSIYHGSKEAQSAKEEFKRVFTDKELPSDIPEVKLTGNFDLSLMLLTIGASDSKSEARRLIEQGGIKIDGTKITESDAVISTHKGMIIQAGKKRFYKIN